VIRLLKSDYAVALLSRGYKRKTKGTIIAAPMSTAEEIGDEPKQIHSKFPDVTVAVAEKRTEGIERLLDYNRPDVIVMDDAFQHRYVKPGFSVLIIDYYRPLWNDFPFPAGNLREPRSGIKRADVIVINKCPFGLSEKERNDIIKKVKPTPGQKIFFTSIEYLPLVALSGTNAHLNANTEVIALAGISHPKTFIEHLSRTYKIVQLLIFPDHHPYSKKDYLYIKNEFEKIDHENKAVVTTEKDMIRLRNLPWLDDKIKSKIWYIPIKLLFLFDEERIFNKMIKDYVEKNKKNG